MKLGNCIGSIVGTVALSLGLVACGVSLETRDLHPDGLPFTMSVASEAAITSSTMGTTGKEFVIKGPRYRVEATEWPVHPGETEATLKDEELASFKKEAGGPLEMVVDDPNGFVIPYILRGKATKYYRLRAYFIEGGKKYAFQDGLFAKFDRDTAIKVYKGLNPTPRVSTPSKGTGTTSAVIAGAALELVEKADPKMGFRMMMPKGTNTLTEGKSLSSYTYTLPGGADAFAITVSPVAASSLADAARLSKTLGSEQIEEQKEIDGKRFMVRVIPSATKRREIYVYNGKVRAACTGPMDRAADLEKVCLTLEPAQPAQPAPGAKAASAGSPRTATTSAPPVRPKKP